MEWHVHGVDVDGTRVTAVIEAKDRKEALARAKASGLLILALANKPSVDSALASREAKTHPMNSVGKPHVGVATILAFALLLALFFANILTPANPTQPAGGTSNTSSDSALYRFVDGQVETPATKETGGGTSHFRFNATSNPDYSDSAMADVRRMAALTGESEFQIRAATWKVQEMLREAGITESKERILAGMAQVYPRTTQAVKYAECLAAYTLLRKKGHSHEEALLNFQSLLGSLGLQ